LVGFGWGGLQKPPFLLGGPKKRKDIRRGRFVRGGDPTPDKSRGKKKPKGRKSKTEGGGETFWMGDTRGERAAKLGRGKNSIRCFKMGGKLRVGQRGKNFPVWMRLGKTLSEGGCAANKRGLPTTVPGGDKRL